MRTIMVRQEKESTLATMHQQSTRGVHVKHQLNGSPR